MLETETPSGGLIFFSILYRNDLFTEKFLCNELEYEFGPLLTHVPIFNPLSQYYSKEMGNSVLLSRIFLVTGKTFSRGSLLSTKLLSLDWEKKWSQDSRRMVNVDIGFICAENFILATTKNYAHRVFIGQNIFADLTYQCLNGSYQSLPWTYPDFKDQQKVDFLSWCRSYLLMLGKIESL